MIKDYAQAEKEGLVITLPKADRENLEQYLFSRLKEEVKKGITLKTNDDIQAGFLISYDAGKSYYDFTGQSLLDYISAQIKPKLAELFKDVTEKSKMSNLSITKSQTPNKTQSSINSNQKREAVGLIIGKLIIGYYLVIVIWCLVI